MDWPTVFTAKEFLLRYHIGEEFLIAGICFVIVLKIMRCQTEARSAVAAGSGPRGLLAGAGFAILGLSGLIHAGIHAAGLNLNLLYQTLLGYCFGLLVLVMAISAENPDRKKVLLLLYLPFLSLLFPGVYEIFPIFGQFRPLIWISVAYLSGLVSMLMLAAFYRSRDFDALWTATGFLFISISATFLFFPAPIGSPVWMHGHLFRPVGFIILLFCVKPETFSGMGSSILYRALAAFSLLAAVPLLIFGTAIFYEHISPVDIAGRRLMLFLLMLITFAATLVFGLGLIIRLVRPVLRLKDAVGQLFDHGFNRHLTVAGNDEIGELAAAFNDMVLKLSHAIDEQERLCRLAATGELAATLAHEIKNPLNAIGGAAVYIRKNYNGSLIREFTGIICEEVSRINKLTGTLLGFSRPIEHNIAPHDLNRVVRSTIALLDEEARSHNITLTAHLDQDLHPVSCDENQIKQILINLIINAFDAVAAHGKITVSTRAVAGKAMVEVTDNGIGVAADKLRQVFNPFYTTKTRGTGLGLAISKKIAREHQGDLIMESVEGQGSRLTLILEGG